MRAAEDVALDVAGARERVVKISRIPNVLGGVSDEENAVEADVAVRWLAAQLKVALRPAWTPTGKALAEVAGNGFGERVWEVLWDELRKCTREVEGSGTVFTSMEEGGPEEEGLEVPEWMLRLGVDEEEVVDDVDEEEKSWRDPSAHRVRVAIKSWAGRRGCRQERV